MTAPKATATFMNIAFAIAIWFSIPILLPVATALAWVLIVLNLLFSLGIAISIAQTYSSPQE